jgi:GNAT acetyltransferase
MGDEPPFDAALVSWEASPEWAHGYGDPNGIAELLLGHPAWITVCVASSDAPVVAGHVAERTGLEPRRGREFFSQLDDPPPRADRPPARVLGPADLPLLVPTAHALSIDDPERVLRECIAAGVVRDDRVVALAHNGASSPRYGDIGVATVAEHRRRGFAAACAGVVARRIFESGRRPVWCTGEDNVASRRTASAVGFRHVESRVNVFSR